MDISRFKQVARYAWKQSKDLSAEIGKSRLSLFFDMLGCYRKYLMWTNQYMKERFYEKSPEEQAEIGRKYYEAGLIRDAWQKDFRENREFLIKYSDIKYEKASLREKRNKAYTERYHAGKNFSVEYDVNLSRQHYLDGKISIGNNVLLAKHVFIDYSGEVFIKDHVRLASGVIIESHSHTSDGLSSDVAHKSAVPTKLIIEDWVSIGAHSIILETCNRIGRGARIGAGSVVRSDIPPYAIVMGNPAKIVGFVFPPSILEEFEEEKYPPEERIPIDEYSNNYNRFFLKRINIIKDYISI